MKKLINLWKMSIGWDSMTKKQSKYAIGLGAGIAISLFLASVHYILGFIAFAVLALCLPKISHKLNISE